MFEMFEMFDFGLRKPRLTLVFERLLNAARLCLHLGSKRVGKTTAMSITEADGDSPKPRRDSFAALGSATETPASGPLAPRIGEPRVLTGLAILLFVVGLLLMVSHAVGFGAGLVEISAALGIIAIATSLFRRIELRLIDIEGVLRNGRR
jgi:hypothetical protein